MLIVLSVNVVVCYENHKTSKLATQSYQPNITKSFLFVITTSYNKTCTSKQNKTIQIKTAPLKKCASHPMTITDVLGITVKLWQQSRGVHTLEVNAGLLEVKHLTNLFQPICLRGFVSIVRNPFVVTHTFPLSQRLPSFT